MAGSVREEIGRFGSSTAKGGFNRINNCSKLCIILTLACHELSSLVPLAELSKRPYAVLIRLQVGELEVLLAADRAHIARLQVRALPVAIHELMPVILHICLELWIAIVRWQYLHT